MVKKIFPLIIILTVWFIFSYPVFLQNKIAYPSDFQVNHYSLWNQYQYKEFLGPIKNPAMPDVVGQLYPWKKFTIESLKNGQIPFWDPYTMAGNPHMANYQSAVFSPTNIFYFIFDFNNAWNLAVVIQPLLAGIFTYLFARSLKLSNSASVLASVSFMFCGFITTWMNYTTLSLAISFLPLALFSIEKYLNKNNILWLFVLTIAVSLSFFSGHFQTSLYLGIFVYLYILLKSIEYKSVPKFIYLNLFYFFGILIASPQILPTIEFYLDSARSKNFEKVNPLPFNHLPLIIAPDFYGNPVTRNNFSLIYAEYSLFAGTIPFFLSIFTFFLKKRTVFFFIAATIVSLLLGIDSITSDLIVKAQIPVISTSSLSRVLVIFSFSVAILAGFGFDALFDHLVKKKYRKIIYWLIICFIILSSVWLFVLTKTIDPLYQQIALRNLILPSGLFFGLIFSIFIGLRKSFVKISMSILILLTIFDMLRFATKWQPFSSKEFVFPETPVIKELKSLDKTYRTHGQFSAEGSLYYHIPVTEGYNPLYINRYGDLLASISDGKLKSSPRYTVSLPLNPGSIERSVDLLGIKYILLKKSDLKQPWVFPVNSFSEEKFKKIYEDDKFLIYENNDVFPKAYLVGDYTVETDEQKIIDRILNPDFDLRKSIILEKDPGIEKTKDLSGEARIINYSPNKIDIETNSSQNSILILTDNFYPGWGVKVNGEEKEILRADYTFRAINIPKGNNKILFYYDSEFFRWGVYLVFFSIISIMIVLAGTWYTKSKWNRHNKTAKSATKSSAEIANGKQTAKKHKKL